MSLGAVQTGYDITEYAYSSKQKAQSEEFIVEVSSAMETEEGVLGIGFLRAENSNYAYGMCAKYAENSSSDNPVISVVVTKKGFREEYVINIKDVNPANATDIEMFALCSYADATGNGTGGTFGSWQTLNYYRINAKHLGEFDTSNIAEAFANAKQNWAKMVSSMIGEYMDAGIYKQVMDGNKLLEMFNACKNMGYDEKITDYYKVIEERIKYLSEKLKNEDTEVSYQIGAQSFTEDEWNELIEKFDSIQEELKEMMREEQEKREIEEEQNEKIQADIDEVSLLVSETTICTYPDGNLSVNSNENIISYVTCYTEEGIFCKKVGQTKGYRWTITFENREQYDRVIEFINQFPSDWNLRFAANESFWTDFLNDEIDIDGFMEFMKDTNKGVPDYSVTVGDSVFVDKEKAQWAKYLNPLGSDIPLFTINHIPTGETAKIYKSKKYTEDNPIYLIKGTDINGNEYEQEINVNNINPNDCSYIEMLALSAYTGNASPKDYLKLARMRVEAGETSYLEKTDYLEIARRLMEEMKTVRAWEDYFEYKALVDEFTEHFTKL